MFPALLIDGALDFDWSIRSSPLLYNIRSSLELSHDCFAFPYLPFLLGGTFLAGRLQIMAPSVHWLSLAQSPLQANSGAATPKGPCPGEDAFRTSLWTVKDPLRTMRRLKTGLVKLKIIIVLPHLVQVDRHWLTFRSSLADSHVDRQRQVLYVDRHVSREDRPVLWSWLKKTRTLSNIRVGVRSAK